MIKQQYYNMAALDFILISTKRNLSVWCRGYFPDYLNSLITSLALAKINNAIKINIPATCAYSRNLSLGLRPVIISTNTNNT